MTVPPARQWRLWLGSGLGLGLLSPMPGTWGTLPAVGLHGLLAAGLPAGALRPGLGIATLAASGLSLWMAPAACQHWRRPDPPRFVLDEWAGYLLTVALAPPLAWSSLALAAFLLFRLLDITKPPPVRQLDRKLKGPWGILLDDLAAGAMAAGVLWLWQWLGPR